jgi:hypothetical protein
MGKFDKKLDGEKKVRGIKRKVCLHVIFLTTVTNASHSSNPQKNLWRKRRTLRLRCFRAWAATPKRHGGSLHRRRTCSMCARLYGSRARGGAALH